MKQTLLVGCFACILLFLFAYKEKVPVETKFADITVTSPYNEIMRDQIVANFKKNGAEFGVKGEANLDVHVRVSRAFFGGIITFHAIWGNGGEQFTHICPVPNAGNEELAINNCLNLFTSKVIQKKKEHKRNDRNLVVTFSFIHEKDQNYLSGGTS